MGGGMPGGGAPGGAAPGGAAPGGAAPGASGTDQRPLEGYRPNPFVPRGETVPTGGVMAEPPLTYAYGTNWHRLPITARLGFVRPNIPARAVVQPPAPTEAPSFDITITSILWTQDGQAMAVYESGGKSGVVKPGDIVGDWQVVEIWRDRIVVADKKSGGQQTVYITTKAPASSRPPGGTGGGGTGGGGGRRGRPGGGGGNPPGGMPPPVVR